MSGFDSVIIAREKTSGHECDLPPKREIWEQPEMQRWDNLYKLIGRHMPQELCHIYFRDIEWVKSSGKWYKKRVGQSSGDQEAW